MCKLKRLFDLLALVSHHILKSNFRFLYDKKEVPFVESNIAQIDYQKWNRIILKSQIIISIIIFVTEVVDNILLYVTRSQGYGPDTIQWKLIRYLILPTVIDLLLILVSDFVIRKSNNDKLQRIVLILNMVLICTNIAFTHYQFAITLVMYCIPIIISIVYEKISLTTLALILSFFTQTIAIVARGLDPVYGEDIIPTAVIAYVFIFGVYIFARLVLNTLLKRQEELGAILIEAEKSNAAEERVKLSLKMLETLARALDAKDKYTNGHSSRVAAYATTLAENLGWSTEQIELLKYQALLHDIGKIGVPDSILNKPERLTETEFSIIQSHTLIGADILKDMSTVKGAKHVAKHHHERFDGNGYPSNLSGDTIPLHARIICIADAYDAMNSDRIYRKALPPEVIRRELVKGRGTQFDPELLDVFLKLFDEGKLHIRPEVSPLSETDDIQELIIEDIEKVIRNISEQDKKDNNLEDFERFFTYMKNIGQRYHQSIEVISISIRSTDQHPLTMETDSEASKSLELSIRKNIRAVDVYFRYSDFKHVVILLNAGLENIDVISKRITFDFEQALPDNPYEILFEVNECIEKEK